MGTEGPELNLAQKAIVQQAIDAHNAKCGDNDAKKIDADDIFTIAKKDGVISVRIDAYGYDGSKITSKSDGQYDLELSFKDTTFDVDKEYSFKTMTDSSDNVQKLVEQAQNADKKINQKEVTFAGNKDEKYTNIKDINKKFATLMGGDTVTVTAGDEAKGTQPNISLENLDKGLDNLKKLKEKIENADITTETEFLSEEEKDALGIATNNKKAVKGLRKEMLADIEKAIDDLKDMKKALEKEQKQAVKDKNSANKELQALGVDDKSRIALIRKDKGVAEAMADKSDYKPEDVRSDIGGKYAIDELDYWMEEKYAHFETSNLPPHFQSKVVQHMTRLAVQQSIEKYNEGKPDDEQIDLWDIAEITINPKTGDILLGLQDKEVTADNELGYTFVHDGHYDWKIPGFYNPKSGVINASGDLKLEDNGFASTDGVRLLKNQLKSQYQLLEKYSGKDKTNQQKQIDDTINKLKMVGVSDDDIKAIKDGTYQFDL